MHLTNLFLFSTLPYSDRCSLYKAYLAHNYLIRLDEGLTLETSALESLYKGQITLSTLLINQILAYQCLPKSSVRNQYLKFIHSQNSQLVEHFTGIAGIMV